MPHFSLEGVIRNLKMSQLVARFAAVILLVVSLSGLNSANFWRPPIRLPSNPKDQYYECKL